MGCGPAKEIGRRVMAVFAHPDDEAFGPCGTLTRYAAEGSDVYLLTATRGEEGKLHGQTPPFTARTMGEIRTNELDCAAHAIGLRHWLILGYKDGTLGRVPLEELTGCIVRLIRSWKPQVLVTFAPDGLTGHPDHVVISRATGDAFDLAGRSEAFPRHLREGLEPYAPLKLYHYVVPESLVLRLQLDLIGTPDAEVTTVVDAACFSAQRRNAIHCHSSQLVFPSASREGNTEKEKEARIRLRHQNHFVLARSLVERKAPVESDLFEGIPDFSGVPDAH